MSSDKRLFMKIYEVIVTDILNKRYKYGDSLPSLNDLCKDFDTGRNTMRSVMLLLEDRGFIKTHRGRKAEVIFNINDESSRNLYELSIFERKDAYEDIYQLLISFMPELIIELKNHSSKEQLESLITKVNTMYDGKHSSITQEEFTNNLYKITVEAVGVLDNSLLDSLYLSIIRFIYLPIPSNTNKGKSFFNILNLVSEGLPKIAGFLLTANQTMLRKSISILMQTLSRSSLHYVNKIGKHIESDNIQSIPFCWSSDRNLDLLYMKIIIQIIQDINNEVYDDYLPSLQKMADIYQVSIRTIRKATDMLDDYKIIQKTNGLKSKIIIKQIKNPDLLYINKEVIDNIILFKEAMQILFLLIKSIQKNIVSSFSNQDIENIIESTDQSPKQVLDSYIDFVIMNSDSTIQSIYEELIKSLAWNIYSEKMFDLSAYDYDIQLRNQDFIKAIKKRNYDAINEYLDELYTLIEKDINKIIEKHKQI